MRPRVFPAEDNGYHLQQRRFNEAAGIPRGRRSYSAMHRGAKCFNEAAGIPRGRLTGVV